MNPLTTLSSYGIPTHNHTSAVRFALTGNVPGIGPLSKEEYETKIAEVLELMDVPSFKTHDIARICFGYTVQEAVRSFNNNPDSNIKDVWELVQQKTNKFVKESSWVFSKDEESQQTKKPSTLSKKQLALNLWKATDNPTSLSRKEWIELLISKLGLTLAGSATYYANLKSGMWS